MFNDYNINEESYRLMKLPKALTRNAAFNFIIRITFSTRVPDFFKHNKKWKCICACTAFTAF